MRARDLGKPVIGANGTERVLNYHWREWNGKSVERLKNGEAFLDDIFKKEQVSQTCADSPDRKLRNVRILHSVTATPLCGLINSVSPCLLMADSTDKFVVKQEFYPTNFIYS